MSVDAGSMPELSIVLPAYNEQARLPYTLGELARYIEAHRLDCEVIVVDNGSTDATSAVAQQAGGGFGGRLRLLRTDRRGKGRAVRAGMLAAQGRVVLFADADLSWSLGELQRFPSMVSEATPVVIGSREGGGARRVDEPSYRHLMGRVYNRVVQWLVLPGIEDSQCGFKAFSAESARAIFSMQTLDGFGFDVEILYLARRLGYAIHVVPLRWEHKENSRVAPVSDTLRMLRDVVRVRWRARRGAYGRPIRGTTAARAARTASPPGS